MAELVRTGEGCIVDFFFFNLLSLIDEAVGGNVGGFVISKRRGEAGRQGGNGDIKSNWGGDYGCKADR